MWHWFSLSAFYRGSRNLTQVARLAWQSFPAASSFCSFLFKKIYFILCEKVFYLHKCMCIFCVPG